MASNDKTEPSYQEKLREVAVNLASLGKAPRGTFALPENPKQLDNIELQAALDRYRYDAQKTGTLPRNASRDELFTNINAVAQAQVAAAKAAPQDKASKYTLAQTAAYIGLYNADKLPVADIGKLQQALRDNGATQPANPGPGPEPLRVDGKNNEFTKQAAQKFAADHPNQKTEVSAVKPTEVKAISADDLKEQEAKAYLRVLGKKDVEEFRADNILHGGADLKGKELTSPEVLAALKARVTGSEEAQNFARSMLEKDATQDRKPGLKNADLKGDDVIALQYMLKANGKNLGGFAHNGQPDLKDGIDGTLGKFTREAAEAVAGPSLGKKGPAAAAPQTTSTPKAETERTAQAVAANPGAPAPVEDRSTYSPAALEEKRLRESPSAQGGTGLPGRGGAQTSGRPVPAEEDARSGGRQPSNYRAPIYQQTYGNNQYREDYNGLARGVQMRPTYAQPIYNSPFEARQARQAENFELARERLYQQAALRQESRMLNGGGYYPGSPMGSQVNLRVQDHYNRASAGIGMGPNGIELRNVGVHMGQGGNRVDLGIPRMILGALGG